MTRAFVLFGALTMILQGQEARSGFELATTITAGVDYSHELTEVPGRSPVLGGVRALLYPTWKLSDHWSIAGAVQVRSQPYFYEEFSRADSGVKADVLQANLSYERVSSNRSLVVRVGELSSAFGSFLLRYDDAVNPLVDMPVTYGYYYKGVTSLSLAGAEVDATAGKADFRGQFVNSSAANRRNLLDRDQYGNWAGGAGYTLAQGFRIGVSAYHGPYLDRGYPFYFPGEAKPADLSATAFGVDVQWGRGPVNVYGEWQHFHMPYHAIHTFSEQAGYGEIRYVLHPRWYVAARAGYLQASAFPESETYEAALGYRPNSRQLVKLDYEIERGPAVRSTLNNVLSIQLVTQLRPFSIASR